MEIRPADMRRVLVLSYYFPPLGLSGVQRITKFVKYLPENGWLPTVVSAKPFSYFAFDNSLETDLPESVSVHRTSSLDPTRWTLKKGTVSIPNVQRHSLMRSLSNRLFVPDNKVLWIPFARRAAERIIGSQQIDLIFSTAPPFSSHVLATALGKKHGIPVVTDYRDNWVGNPRAVYASKRQKERHARLEYSALIGSDHVVTINDYIVKDMVARSKISPKTISVIEQGYDPDDYPDRFRIAPTDDSVTFVHSGIFYDAQKPDTFLQGLALARDRSKLVREKAKAVFIGLVPDNFSEMLQELGLLSVVSHTGYLDHREALARLMSSQVPWLTIGHQVGSEQISTGKLAEYVGSEKPILGLVPNGAAKDMLDAYGDGHVAPPDDVAEVARLIVLLTERFQNGTDNVQDQIAPTADKVNHSYVRKLNRKVLTKELASIFDRCANAG